MGLSTKFREGMIEGLASLTVWVLVLLVCSWFLPAEYIGRVIKVIITAGCSP